MSYDPQPGMRVVCIRDDWGQPCQYHPERGKVYTIKSVEADEMVGDIVYIGTYLGFDECPVESGGEPMFHSKCFKPLDETRLDVFRRHLNTVPGPWERVGA
ncbi:hypothetical protein GN330_22810 [Nitratireductor sp. CAU 1489]|uniref:Uncharacterized protein n=1 Tax=Nitratireductor arenosus TaxID=2682096 RepID=A0A844QQ37_9HYPH|nr:hypothetical protein [Nitratireductor arenosus]MVB00081.1 hypothetical protein [Nitratireductor arenosus]